MASYAQLAHSLEDQTRCIQQSIHNIEQQNSNHTQTAYSRHTCRYHHNLAPNDTTYKRWSCHKLVCKLCQTFPPPAMGGTDLQFFGQAGEADPLDGWRCFSQKRRMSRPIQVRQHHTNESGSVISAINKYILGSGPSRKSEINLIIIQVNINGIKQLEELKLLIHDTHADIITIQEIKLVPKAKTPKVHNFTTVRTDRLHKAGGGLMTLIRDNITFTTTDIPLTINTHNTELQMAKVRINNTKHITIANIYIPPRDSTSTHYKTPETDIQHYIQYITNIPHSVQSGPKNKQHCTTHGNAPKCYGPYLRPLTHIQHTHSQDLSTSTQATTNDKTLTATGWVNRRRHSWRPIRQ